MRKRLHNATGLLLRKVQNRPAALEWAFVVVVVFFAFLLRVWGLSKIHFWDEAVYLQNAQVICCGKNNYSELDFRPPLLSLILAAVFLVWRNIYVADIAVALLNALGPALLYLSGRMIVGRIPAGIASLLLAFAPFFVGVFPVGFDSDNTGNSLLSDSPALTLVLLSFFLLLRALRRQSDWRFALVGVAFALTVLMRFASLSTIGVLALLIFAADRWWRAAFACAAGFCAVLTPYLCWSRATYGGFFETIHRGWEYYQGARQSPLFYVTNFGTIFCWITLAGLVLWVGHWSFRWRGRTAVGLAVDHNSQGLPPWIESFLWLWAALAIVFFFALPHQEPRYLMPAAPPLFLLAGSGLSLLFRLPSPPARITGTVLVAAGLVWSFLPDVQRFDTPLVDNSSIEEMRVSEFLNETFPRGTIVYSNFNYPLFGYYSDLPVRELPESGPRLYDALSHLPDDGILIAYKPSDDVSYPQPSWLGSNPHFRVFQEFPSLVLYEYRVNAEKDFNLPAVHHP